jgi:hypothetical protein
MVLRRTLSLILLGGALACAAEVIHQSTQRDENGDVGPPMGALCTAAPAFILLIAAGAAWPSNPKGKN